jgi:hypothetical protein
VTQRSGENGQNALKLVEEGKGIHAVFTTKFVARLFCIFKTRDSDPLYFTWWIKIQLKIQYI